MTQIKDDSERKNMFDLALSDAQESVRLMAEGNVVRSYNVATDCFDWHYGTIKFPRLQDENGDLLQDDPLNSVAVFPASRLWEYFSTYYWPRRAELAAKKSG